jgi:mannose-6-phosphate isomerase-like protein (cupin superfamily)
MRAQYGPLEVVDEQRLADACRYPWFNTTLCEVNDTWIRLGVCQGEYHWHQHNDTDEFFYVIEGKWLIDLPERTVELGPRQAFVVPKGVQHRPRAPERTVVLMAERKGVVPEGT